MSGKYIGLAVFLFILMVQLFLLFGVIIVFIDEIKDGGLIEGILGLLICVPCIVTFINMTLTDIKKMFR